MKRKLVILICVLAVLVGSLLWLVVDVVGTVGDRPTVEEIDAATLDAIRKAYVVERGVASAPEEVTVLAYCGTYHDCVVLQLTDPDSMYLCAVTTEMVAGILFRYSDSNTLYAFCDGKLMSLKDAYEADHLTRGDLRHIRNIWNGY